MKDKTVILSASCLTGFLIFLIRESKDEIMTSSQSSQQLFIVFLAIYFLVKRYNTLRTDKEERYLSYGELFWVGFRVILIARVIGGFLSLTFPLYTTQMSRILVGLNTTLSVIISGALISSIWAAILIYKQKHY